MEQDKLFLGAAGISGTLKFPVMKDDPTTNCDAPLEIVQQLRNALTVLFLAIDRLKDDDIEDTEKQYLNYLVEQHAGLISSKVDELTTGFHRGTKPGIKIPLYN